MEELIVNGEYEDIMCIYKIENRITKKVYIGSTNNLRQRINSHIRKLKNNTHRNPILQNSWNATRNENNFYFEIVELINDESFLPFAELYYIEKYRRINGVYNISNPLDEVHVFKSREKKNEVNPESKTATRKEKIKINKIIRSTIKSEFEYMLVKLKEKANECAYVEFQKIYEYVIKNISLKNYDHDDIKSNLIKVIKYYDLTVYSFESSVYTDELLNKHGFVRKPSVISKERAKKLYEEVHTINTK